jgi:hypothetical protein
MGSDSRSEKSKGSEQLTTKLTNPAQFVPAHGRGKLNVGGTPGHRRGSGRPPNELKAFWASLLNGETSRNELKRVLENADHPAFATLYSKIALHLVGPPARPQDNRDEEQIMGVLDL